MFKQLYVPLLACAFSGMFDLKSMNSTSQNRFAFDDLENFKLTLQKNIADKDWGATIQTYDAFHKFLHNESTRRTYAFGYQDLHKIRSYLYGGLTLISMLCLRSKARTAASLIAGSMAVHNGIQNATITPKNVFDRDKRWVENTINPIRPHLLQFLDAHYEKNLQELSEKHM